MKNIVIIGGSQGIGLAVLKQVVEQHRVVNISRNTPEFNHPNLSHHSVDILGDDLPQLDRVDGLVYCPGSINLKPFARLKSDDFISDFNINVMGAVKALQFYLPALQKSEAASVVLFSTVASKLGMPYHASIAVSKSGIEGLTKSLAAEFAPDIRFNAVAPTVTDTPLASRLLRNDKMKENISDRHPLKRYLNPEDVANAVTYLLSDRSKALTGQVIQLDSGIVSVKL